MVVPVDWLLNNDKAVTRKNVFYRYKDGQIFRDSDPRVKMTVTPDGSCTLTITSMTNEDAGMYTCEVSNESGMNKSEAKVTVSG